MIIFRGNGAVHKKMKAVLKQKLPTTFGCGQFLLVH